MRKFVLIGLVLSYAGVLLLAPMLALVINLLEYGLDTIWAAITTPEALLALRLSLILALCSVMINTVMGVLIAWVLVRHQFWGKRFFNAVVDLPFVVSPVIVGYVLIVLFGRQGWLSGFPVQLAFSTAGMLLVTVFVSLPFVIREVMPVLAAITPEQEEAAFTLGASHTLTFRRILLPILWPSILYGIVLTLARSLGEFGAAAVAGGGVQGVTETATIYVYRALQDRNDVGAYSIAVILGLMAVGILILMNWLRPQEGKKHVD
ncbi:MAG: sulfate ABC transporter permease subunit [Anaerolineae bacterium]|jgi:sulfate transport system permease protein|nr:sulfate ABC transporter permease subunit [Anaerolineae bacterium]